MFFGASFSVCLQSVAKIVIKREREREPNEDVISYLFNIYYTVLGGGTYARVFVHARVCAQVFCGCHTSKHEVKRQTSTRFIIKTYHPPLGV